MQIIIGDIADDQPCPIFAIDLAPPASNVRNDCQLLSRRGYLLVNN